MIAMGGIAMMIAGKIMPFLYELPRSTEYLPPCLTTFTAAKPYKTAAIAPTI